MRKQLLQHKKFTTAALTALVAVSFGATTALASPQDCPPNCQYTTNNDRPHPHDFRPEFHHIAFNPDYAAAAIAENYGIDKAVVESYLNEGWHPRAIEQGCLLADLSGQSLESIMESRSQGLSWREVAESVNVTQDNIANARFKSFAQDFAQRNDMNEFTARRLLEDGYHPEDIAIANAIAKRSDTPIYKVISLRKINNTWQDVAREVGLSPRDTHGIFAPRHR